MNKQQIIDYVMNSPANTNPNVLGTMLDSMDGMVNMVTLFDDDITGFIYEPSSQYGPASARLSDTIIPVSTVKNGILKISYEGVSVLTSLSNGYYSASLYYNDLDLPFETFNISSYDTVDVSMISLYGKTNQDTEFEAYCQEPHHLKVEWFTI